MVSSTPISWNLLRKFSWNSPPRIVLGRSLESNTKYREYRLTLQEKGISSYTNIMDLFVTGGKYVLEHNNFPYFMEPGIEHYIVWINPRDDSEWKITEIEDLIVAELFGNDRERMKRDCVCFQNIYELRSIKDISHIQVFIRVY